MKCPICEGELESSLRKQCTGSCKQGDRQRTVYLVVKSLSNLFLNKTALIFSREAWINPNWFETCHFSVYGGENSLDIQDLSSVSIKYDWISCNHILEHVLDDSKALRELYSKLSENGVLQIQVPSPGSFTKTHGWGYPDPKKYGHYREYGTDFSIILKESLKEAHFLGCFAKDPYTPLRDIIFFVSPNRDYLLNISYFLKKNGGYLSFVF